jgi:hypothetical protein
MGRAEDLIWRARAALALRMAIAAGVLAALVLGVAARSPNAAAIAGPRLAAPHSVLSEAVQIRFETRSSRVTLRKAGQAWRLDERAGYRADPARIESLLAALSNARATRAMTNLVDRHGALGLGAPGQGGEGARLIVEDAQGRALVDLIIGRAAPEGLYVRRTHSAQTYAATLALATDVTAPLAWIDLSALPATMRQRVAGVSVQPLAGPDYTLQRERDGQPFAFAAPFEAAVIVAPIGVSATANALFSIVALDVAPANRIFAQPVGLVTATLFDGLEVTGVVSGGAESRWLRLSFNAQRPRATEEANALTAALSGWAFQISDQDAQTLIAPLNTLARFP